MLQLAVLRENTQEVKERLSKRNPAFAIVVDEVITLDEKARAACYSTQKFCAKND